MADELKCERVIKRCEQKTPQGKPIWFHEKCGKPAQEVEIGGTLTKAKAILCAAHKLQADRHSFTSENGYPLGKIKKKLKKEGYRQNRLKGTGVLESEDESGAIGL